jgi:hypothetical protein
MHMQTLFMHMHAMSTKVIAAAVITAATPAEFEAEQQRSS